MKAILDEARALSDEITAWRRSLHEIPELGLSRDRENVTPKCWKMGQGKCHPLSFFLYETRTP